MTPDSPDRTVHGITRDGYEVVRYDRAGKWYVEGGAANARQLVSLKVAAKLIARGGTHYLNRPGGRMFDRAVDRFRTGAV